MIEGGVGDRSARLARLASAQARLRLVREKAACEASLLEFFKAAWPHINSDPLQTSWHHDVIARHLEAVSRGHIRKLCINLPPRHTKTVLVSVCWNAWLWCQPPDPRYPLMGPGAKFMCLSYADPLAMDNAILTRRLIGSKWYQDRWGDRVRITFDQDAKNKFDTDAGGTRISGSFKGTVTGRGAGIRVYDDPHKMDEVESKTIREGVLRLYDTTLKSRITDPRTSAEVLIAQRGHVQDLTTKFLESGDVVHLNLPAEYDPSRHCSTVLKRDAAGRPLETWDDPRTDEGELLWPDRFGARELAPYKRNRYEWQSQWQQAPAARGGSILQTDWWQPYEVPASGTWNFEPLFVLASLDTAFKEKEENDFSALTVWAVYDDPSTGRRCVMLQDGWKKRLPMHGVRVPRNSDEDVRTWERRASPKWGLVEWANFTCERRKVNRLLIEDSARGHDVAAEIQRIYGSRPWQTILVPARIDKVARVHSVMHMFTDEMIYAPGEWVCPAHQVARCKSCPPEPAVWRWRDMADMVIDEASAFPRGDHDDVVDTITMALKHLRDVGLAIRREERQLVDDVAARARPSNQPLYPA